MINIVYASTILGMDIVIFLVIMICLGVLALGAFLFYLASIFVDKGHVKIIERAGKYHKTLTSGWHFVFPILDKVVIDLSTEHRIFDCKTELSILGINEKVFKFSYSFSYILFNPCDFYYLTSSEKKNVEFVINQIVLDYYNKLYLKTAKSVYDANNIMLIDYINSRISEYGIKVDDFIIRTVVVAS